MAITMVPSTLSTYRKAAGYGIEVERGIAAHAAATTPYFTVSAAGLVLVTGIVGLVTTVSNPGANVCRWIAQPTAGAAVNLCADLDVLDLAIGNILSITGVAADAMIAGGGVGIMTRRGIVVTAGSISFAAALALGATSWRLWYIPVIAGSTVTAI